MRSLLVLACLVPWALGYVQYDGYKVIRFHPENEVQVSALNALESEVDFWKAPTVPGKKADIMFAPDQQHLIDSLGVPHEEYIADVGSLMAKSLPVMKHGPGTDHFNTSYFYTQAELSAYVDEAAAECGADCSFVTIGNSYEGRPLKVIRISRPGTDRPSIWIDGGIHAREWLAPAVTSYIIDQLIHQYGVDPEVTLIRDTFDFYIHNLVNPDGYEYTWTTDRMWRKTRSPNAGSPCDGTDANRNYDYAWASGSDQECSETYSGASAHSEVEISSLTDYVLTFAPSAVLSLSLHTYGQEIFRPWASDPVDPPDVADLVRMSDIGVAAINANSDTTYTSQKSSGTNSGISMDWAKGGAGIKYAYVVEMRDQGQYGFIAPPEEILPTCVEIFAGVKAMATDLAP